jgi:transposase-like protein
MLLPPLNLSMAEVSRREGVSEMSLSNWRKQRKRSINPTFKVAT